MNHSVSFDGALITLLECNKNKEFLCKKDCYKKRDCNIKRLFTLNKPYVNKITVTEIIIEILNIMESPWKTSLSQWSIVDTLSYVYDCLDFCDELRNPRFKSFMISSNIQSNTTVRAALYFPEIENCLEVSSLICSTRESHSKIQINPLAQAVITKMEEQAAQINMQSILNGNQSSIIRNSVFELERLCKSRVLQKNSRDGERIEQKVNEKILELEQQSRSYPDNIRLAVSSMVASILSEYSSELEVVKQKENNTEKWYAQLNQLHEMEPRDFEIWTADLFEALGYTVELTPQSNDGGVDVLCYKNNKIIAVQCKRHKGIVGSPDIQKFIGAIVNANADVGYFITTGTFSVTAEKFAKDANVALYDKTSLKELIDLALNN